MAFTLSKILWAFVSPGNLLVFLLAGGMALTTTPWDRLRKSGKFLCVFAAACFLAIATLPVGDWALAPLENRMAFNPPAPVDGIILLGGDEQLAVTQERGVPTALDSMRRYQVFADLARRYPDARLVFSGGTPIPHPLIKTQESAVARDILRDFGVPVDRMVFEKNARNTYENAVMTADIVRPPPSQNWLLVTSAWHMPRSIGCFRKAGWNIYPAPAGYFTAGSSSFYFIYAFDDEMHKLTLAAHEYIGLVAYWLMGRTSALWPN